ncbi:MAG: hypothetical protein O2782_01285 [bacterium]|nr:hypothetical protein [bacterium]
MKTHFGLFTERADQTIFAAALMVMTILSGPRTALADAGPPGIDLARIDLARIDLAQTTHGISGAASFDGSSDPRSPGTHGFLTVRRSLGAVFLAGSVVLVMQGFDLKDQADGFYAAYESATDPAEIEKFYQRTTNRDVKSQVSWALAAAFGITGLRLALTGGDSGPASMQTGALASTATEPGTGSSLSLVPAVSPRVVGLALQRHFF